MFRTITILWIGLLAAGPALLFQSNHQIGGAGAETRGLLFLAVPGLVVLNIVMLLWVYRDATNRGMESAVIWLIIVLAFSFLGTILYLLSRPKGTLVPCSHCAAKRLPGSAQCPHCGKA